MTTFLDGPAEGQTLFLKRAPVYLRVVQGPDRSWDALDQLDDHARSGERIVVYELQGEPTFCHINRGRNGSGFYRGGPYRVVTPQPADDEVRSNVNWHRWVEGRVGLPLNVDGSAKAVD